jgi:anhydro-N-acetylmuramic acid kinase
MSGTSLDGVDGVLMQWSGPNFSVLAHHHIPFTEALKSEFLQLNSSGADELHRSYLAGNALTRLYAEVVQALLAAQLLKAGEIQAIGAHGQTVRHQPLAFDGVGYTIQINNPALLAELTGIAVVSDFRSRDLAAGGQGAPLVPAFHQALWGQTPQGQMAAPTLVLNLGGMSNVTVLNSQQVWGFDCGPGNALMDDWCQLHNGQPFDESGQWAAQGCVDQNLLQCLLADSYFQRAPPKSTGRDHFHLAWLRSRLTAFETSTPVDVMATLTELTARVCSADAFRVAPTGRLVVCGGGAFNLHLMERLKSLLPGWQVAPSSEYGLKPTQVEAAAFAWLARQHIMGNTASLSSVTGARGPRVLGALYPA